MTNVEDYSGRKQVLRDIADPERVHLLAATLDHDTPPWRAGVLPPLGHWLCFRPDARQSSIGADGHPVRTDDGFLPNVDLPRRMWAGSRIRFLQDIPLGKTIVRTSTIKAATHKQGRSGAMMFVTVDHVIAAEGGEPAILEEQDIVYREAAAPGAGAAAAQPAAVVEEEGEVVRRLVPDPVMLFRYSALTFNAHRIHYDRDYARLEEGYPGLVVHGPLIATLLMDHLLRQRPAERIAGYDFRAMSPLFDGQPMTVGSTGEGPEVKLRAVGQAGVAMTATATIGE
jgi:3-methylfumaryl-CoA hydratase